MSTLNTTDERINKTVDRNTKINHIADAIKRQFLYKRNTNFNLRYFKRTASGTMTLNEFYRASELYKLCLDAARQSLDPSTTGVYVTLQDFDLDKLLEDIKKDKADKDKADKDKIKAVRDKHATFFTHFLIDADPVRLDDSGDMLSSDRPSTDKEHDAAIKVIRKIAAYLLEEYNIRPHIADSGNGGHGILELTEPVEATDENKNIIKDALYYFASEFSNALVSIDTGVHNPGQVSKIYGTMVRKGEEEGERVYRIAKILERSTAAKIDFNVIREWAARYRSQNVKISSSSNQSSVNYNSRPKRKIPNHKERIAQWGHGIYKTQEQNYRGTEVIIYGINRCPMNPEHEQSSIFIYNKNTGKLSFMCQHDGTSKCNDYQIDDVLAKHDPELLQKLQESELTPPDFFEWKKVRNRDTGKEENHITRFLIQKCGEYIKQDMRFVTFTDTHEILWHNERTGLYEPGGEERIRTKCREVLGEFANRSRIDEVFTHIRDTTYINRADLELSPELVPVGNGILDTDTRELIDFSPDILCLSKLAVNYDAEAECPKIQKFLGDVLDEGAIDVLQEAIGYILERDYRYRMSAMFLGTGYNGKTILLNIITAMVGALNISNVSLHDLTELI